MFFLLFNICIQYFYFISLSSFDHSNIAVTVSSCTDNKAVLYFLLQMFQAICSCFLSYFVINILFYIVFFPIFEKYLTCKSLFMYDLMILALIIGGTCTWSRFLRLQIWRLLSYNLNDGRLTTVATESKLVLLLFSPANSCQENWPDELTKTEMTESVCAEMWGCGTQVRLFLSS